jgi:hypothetical protein
MMRSASAWILLSFFVIDICVNSPNPNTTAVSKNRSNDCVIHPVASFRVQAPGTAYRPSASHEGGVGLSGNIVDMFIEVEFAIKGHF